jgi:hypothetical protein
VPRLVVLVAAMAVALTACGGSSGARVASIEDATFDPATNTTTEAGVVDEEAAVLAFAECMRDQGVTDFEDPDIGADGSIEFRLRGQAEASGVDRETMQAAFEACRTEIEGLAFGPGSVDRSEIEDDLVEFAACVRDNGYDMPDPDFSAMGPGQGGEEGQGGPFAGIDPDDPAFRSAVDACQEIFGGLPFGGRGPGGGPDEGGDG